ncbi:hypothetical protein DTO027B5_7489 [Paecilomyces variotii]|nr:hypothetical protein DTO021C3_4672 [Paecilomyces variotii]KAJ9330688.1 hypothetical protein DTO027B5_7489 [Paecilomyces variotii]
MASAADGNQVALRLGGGGSLLSLGLGGGGSGLTLSLLFLDLTGTGGLGLVAIGRGPEGKVVTQQLHDESAVTVGLLGERVKLGDRIVEGLLGKVASAIGGVEDLVVEDGEVQSQSETDGVSRSELALGDVGSSLSESVIVSTLQLTN